MYSLELSSLRLNSILSPQRLQFSDMSINQCQSGVDDSSDIPAELFDQERMRLAKKGAAFKKIYLSF